METVPWRNIGNTWRNAKSNITNRGFRANNQTFVTCEQVKKSRRFLSKKVSRKRQWSYSPVSDSISFFKIIKCLLKLNTLFLQFFHIAISHNSSRSLSNYLPAQWINLHRNKCPPGCALRRKNPLKKIKFWPNFTMSKLTPRLAIQ